jgi:hypothetical protein
VGCVMHDFLKTDCWVVCLGVFLQNRIWLLVSALQLRSRGIADCVGNATVIQIDVDTFNSDMSQFRGFGAFIHCLIHQVGARDVAIGTSDQRAALSPIRVGILFPVPQANDGRHTAQLKVEVAEYNAEEFADTRCSDPCSSHGEHSCITGPVEGGVLSQVLEGIRGFPLHEKVPVGLGDVLAVASIAVEAVENWG